MARLSPCCRMLLALVAGAALVAPSEPALARRPRRSNAPPTPPPVASPMSSTKLTYPVTRRSNQVDDYHGQQIADPYRWLEDLDSAETRAWVEAQNKLTGAWLARLPGRELIRRRLTKLWNYERFGLPVKRGGKYFYTRNDGLQNQSVLFVIDSEGAEPRLLFDPNTLSQDGTIALASWVPSEDGSLVAFGLAGAGYDWHEWGVLDVASGRVLLDKLKWVKFSRASWSRDGRGFYYSRYDEPPPGQTGTSLNYYQKLYYHRVGDPQERDTLVYERRGEKEWGFDGSVSDDGRYLVISVWRGTERKNQIFYKDLSEPGAPIVELITGFDAEYDFIDNDGPVFWLVTDQDAPLRRIIAVDLRQPNRSAWREIVPESTDTLQHASIVGERLIVQYLKDACSAVRIFDLAGQPVGQVALPQLGSVGGFSGRREDAETFYLFTNYTTPGSIYRYDVATGKSTLFREPRVDFDPAQFATRQIFYASKDGTRVPLQIVHKRGIALDGQNPTILYGYGGFNISQTPGFAISTLAWLEMGGVYVVANLRGGGEYGRPWHEAGMLERKQNVFDDFVAAAEWLIDSKYTSPDRLAIRGGSNGGLLVGAVMTQRPELFAAAVPAVGVMDMLRFHKFTIGWAWASEFGSADDPQQFRTLLAYSPLHNLKPDGRYPATLITTADHDDRVVPGHSYKFAAALQAAQAAPNVVLIRIETSAGHGAGTPTSKQIDMATDVLSFLVAILRVPT